MIFNHTGNLGDILYSIPFVIELCENLKIKLNSVIFNIQINVKANYVFKHPYGDVLMTKNSAEFLKPLLQIIGFKDITISEEKPKDCIPLEHFRLKQINTMAGDIRSYYYSLSKIHLSQDMSRKYFNFKFKDQRFKNKIILCISDRYLNPYINVKLLEEFKDNFIFMGLQDEYNNFIKNYFKVQYVKIKNALEAAVVFNSCLGMIGVVGGLYSIAEMMKIPRILITPEFIKIKKYKDKKIIEGIVKGPVNVIPCGGWFENARSDNKLINSTRELVSFIKTDDFKNELITQRIKDDPLNQLVKDFLSNKKDLIGIEIGSYRGESTDIFLKSGAFKKLYCIDPWKEGYDNNDAASSSSIIYAEKDFDKKFKDNKIIEKIKDKSINVKDKFDNESIDFIYIDGNHQYEYVKSDIENYFNKIKNGGIIAGHDYNKDAWPGVVKAVNEFFNKSPLKVYSDNSWIFYKTNLNIINYENIDKIIPTSDTMIYCTCAEKNQKEYLEKINIWFNRYSKINADFYVFNDGHILDENKIFKLDNRIKIIEFNENFGRPNLVGAVFPGWKRSFGYAMKLSLKYKYFCHIENDCFIKDLKLFETKLKTDNLVYAPYCVNHRWIESACIIINNNEIKRKCYEYFIDKEHQYETQFFEKRLEELIGNYERYGKSLRLENPKNIDSNNYVVLNQCSIDQLKEFNKKYLN